jgi:membrane protein implicated in regulation of membrane protease activity
MKLPILVLVAGLGVAAFAIPAVYLLALAICPPWTGDGHRVMPIAQVGVASIAGVLLGVVAAVLVARAAPKRK